MFCAAAVVLLSLAAHHPAGRIGSASFIPAPLAEPASPGWVPGQVLVKFKPTASSLMKAAALVAFESQAIARLAHLDVYVVRIGERATVEETVEAFRRNPDVEYAEPNFFAASR